jgi:hypothetical protein
MLAMPVAAEARGWGGRHYRDRVDVGDVLTGVLILGGIAAVASAASKNNRERTRGYPVPYPRDDEYRYRTPGTYDRSESRGIDRAVDMCVAEVEERSGRVGSVDSANRDAGGWQISGELENGRAYSCAIDNDGRISDVDIGDERAYAEPADGQWSDEDYARARAQNEAAPEPEPEAEEQDDGRYSTAQAPDFS